MLRVKSVMPIRQIKEFHKKDSNQNQNDLIIFSLISIYYSRKNKKGNIYSFIFNSLDRKNILMLKIT